MPFSSPFKFLILLLAALCALITFAVPAVLADEIYKTTAYCQQEEDKANEYVIDSYSSLIPAGVVKLDGTHLQITFDRELEYATTIETRDGGNLNQLGPNASFKFIVNDNGTVVDVIKVVPLAAPVVTGSRRTFRAVELELGKIIGDSATVSYDPELKGHNDSLALADPNAGKLTGAFGSVSAAAPQAQLKTLALDTAISDQNDGTLMDENTPMEPTRFFKEFLADDKVSSVVMTFTLDKESDWSVSVNGAAPSTNPGAKAANGSVNVGLEEGWNRIVLTVGDVSQPGFVTYEIWLYKGTPAYNPVESITIESESGELLDTIKFADGYLQGYASIPGSYRSVVVKVAANDDPQSISINDADAPEGRAVVQILAAGYRYYVKITVTGKNGETASYMVELNSRNNDMKLSDLKVYKVAPNGDKNELTLKYRVPGGSGGEGFKQDLEPEGGWRHYYADVEQSDVLGNYKFVVVPTVEANMAVGTDVSVGVKGGMHPQVIKSGEESEKFTIDKPGQNLSLSVKMSRHNYSTGGMDESDYKVQINLVSHYVTPQLESLALYDKFEAKDVLTLSQPELGDGEKTFKTKPNSLNFILKAQIPQDGAITWETNLSKNEYIVLDGTVTVPIDMVWGEKKKIWFKLRNTAAGKDCKYTLDLQQGYAGKFIYLGITPEALSRVWLGVTPGPNFNRINGIMMCTLFDLPAEPGGERIFTDIMNLDDKRYDKLPTRDNDGGSKTITVDWSVCPQIDPKTDASKFFSVASVIPDGSAENWKVGAVTVNSKGTGGTVELTMGNGRTYGFVREYPGSGDSPGMQDTIYPIYLQAELPDGRTRRGEFAYIHSFQEIEVKASLVPNPQLPVIDLAPAETRPPLTGFKILANPITVLHEEASYKFQVVPDIRTYGQLRWYQDGEFIKKYPSAVQWPRYPESTLPIKVWLDIMMSRTPGTPDTVCDNWFIDYSHDPIKWAVRYANDNLDPEKAYNVSEYITVESYDDGWSAAAPGVLVTVKKAPSLPESFLLEGWSQRTGAYAKAEIMISPNIKFGLLKFYAPYFKIREDLSFISMGPRAAYYGSDWIYDNLRGAQETMGRENANKWFTASKRGAVAWHNLKSTGVEGDHALILGESDYLRIKLTNDIDSPWPPKASTRNGDAYFGVYDVMPHDKLNLSDALRLIPRDQPYLVAVADFLKGNYKDKPYRFSEPIKVKVSGYPVNYKVKEGWDYSIGSDYTYIMMTDKKGGTKSAFVSNALKQLKGEDSQQEIDMILAGENGRWEYQKHYILSEMGMKPEDLGLSEDIVIESLTDGRTGVEMIADIEGSSGEGAKSGGRKGAALSAAGATAAAGEIEWICPDIPGAEEMRVTYGGTPVSSDLSLYYDQLDELSKKEASGARTSRGSSARPKLAPMKISFAVDSNAFEDLELLGFNYKMKGSDEVYCVKLEGGTSANGGFSFNDAAKNEEKKDPVANSGGGSGCNGGFAGLLALFAAVLPLCATKRGRS